METHTSCFASIFFCFFVFRLFTFSHCASSGSSSEGIISDSETRGDVFCFFEWTDEDEEGRFMAVAFWETIGPPRAPNTRPYRINIASSRRWAGDILIPTLTIQSTTFPLVQNGLRASPGTAQEISLMATFRMLTSPLSSSPID